MSEIKFTREDVKALRHLIALVREIYGTYPGAADQVELLANKIESLLSPESPHPEKEI